MSYWPGPSLEDFVKWLKPTAKQPYLTKVLEFYEPKRKVIEQKLQNYSQEEHGPFNIYVCEYIWEQGIEDYGNR